MVIGCYRHEHGGVQLVLYIDIGTIMAQKLTMTVYVTIMYLYTTVAISFIIVFNVVI